jgi:hypothetical protein
MLFLSIEHKTAPFVRPLTLLGFLGVVALGTTIAVPTTPTSPNQPQDWNTQHTPSNLPTLDWAATPPAPEKRLNPQPLDMSYPEVAALLERRMGRYESSARIRATASQLFRLCYLLGFQPSFVLAVIEHESSFRPRIVSPAGAVGLMQLLPATARIVGKQLNIAVPPGGPNLMDPVVSVTLGMHYLAQLQDDFKTPASTLAAYNMGPQRWVEYLSRPEMKRPRTVAKYVALIERSMAQIREEGKLAWKPRLASASPEIRHELSPSGVSPESSRATRKRPQS